MSIWSGFQSAVSGGAPIGTLIGNRRALGKQQENFNTQWDRELWASNTQYQRGVADLKAAGLNPMLAYQNVSSPVPSVDPPQVRSVMEGVSEAASAHSARSVQKAQVQAVAAQTAASAAQARKTNAEAKIIEDSHPFSANNAQVKSLTLDREFQVLGEKLKSSGFQATQDRMTTEQMEKMQPLLLEAQKLLNEANRLGLSEKEVMSKWFERVGEGSPAAKAMMQIFMFLRNMQR